MAPFGVTRACISWLKKYSFTQNSLTAYSLVWVDFLLLVCGIYRNWNGYSFIANEIHGQENVNTVTSGHYVRGSMFGAVYCIRSNTKDGPIHRGNANL